MATDPSPASRVRESLSYKLGPLPAWVWGVLLGVSILGFQAWRRRGDEPPAAEGEGGDGMPVADNTSSEIVTGTASGYGDFVLSPSPMGGGTWASAPLVTAPAGDTAAAPSTTPETNSQWRTLATSWLIAADYTPTLAADAIAKYLDGVALNAAEKAAVNAVLAVLGVPPQGAPSILDAPAPPPQPEAPVVVINPPGAVRNLRLGSIDANGVRIGWDEPASNGGASVFQYVTEREHQASPGAWTTVTTPATNVMHPIPASSGKWRVRVAAQNSRGIGPWTVTDWITAYAPAPAAPAPAAPAPAPAKPADTLATVTSSGSDSTLWNMMRRVYGRNPSARAVSQVAAYNGLRLVGSGTSAYPSPWRIGQQIKLPPAASINW